jgi:hypothetical protein
MFPSKNGDNNININSLLRPLIPETKYFSSYNLNHVAPQSYKEQEFPTFNAYEFTNSQKNKVPVSLY